MNATSWIHTDLWKRVGKGFIVEIRRHTEKANEYGNGPNRWAVYAYIYPSHPYFSKFSGPEMFQEAATALPLHCGPSFLRWHRDDNGKPTSVQVGADYQHLYDRHTHDETQQDAYKQFADADDLFTWLETRGKD